MSEIEYIKVGDYFYPALELEPLPEEELNRWGRMREKFLKEERPGIFEAKLYLQTLVPHLIYMQHKAEEMFDRLMTEMAEKEGVDEELKMKNQLEWVGKMNNFKQRATEIVIREVIESEDFTSTI